MGTSVPFGITEGQASGDPTIITSHGDESKIFPPQFRHVVQTGAEYALHLCLGDVSPVLPL